MKSSGSVNWPLLEARAEIIKALAHPARLMVVEELGRGERCVCELRALAGSDMSTVSKHLAILRSAGIVACDKRGLKVFYRLCCPCLTGFIRCVEAVLRRNAGAQMRRLRKSAA